VETVLSTQLISYLRLKLLISLSTQITEIKSNKLLIIKQCCSRNLSYPPKMSIIYKILVINFINLVQTIKDNPNNVLFQVEYRK